MLKLTRVTGIMDTSRLAAAVSRPGIDPRTWFSYAAVDAIGVDAEGVFVDVTLLPTTNKATARLSSIYSGPGYGFHIPVGINDEVVVAIPDGDPLHGVTIIGRMHSASDELSGDAQSHPTDLVLVVQDGVSLRINVSGGGTVCLGSTEATEAAVMGSTYRNAEDSLLSSIEACLTSVAGAVAALATATPTLTGSPAAIAAFAAAVTAAAAATTSLASAVAAFNAGTATYLSRKVTIG